MNSCTYSSNLLEKKKKNGCGPVAGNHWLNYVTSSLLGLRRYPIGPLIAKAPNWLSANGSHYATWENPEWKINQTNPFQPRNCMNGQNLRSESKLIKLGDYTSIETGQVYLAARGNHGSDSRPLRNPDGPPRPNVTSTPPT